jgi:uncharacterized membrane protein YfcA
VGLALIAEIIDSSLGMMYGTLLSPLLILIGFDPAVIVPSILFSQAVGGLVAAARHHYFGNADFRVSSNDFKSFIAIVVPGILAVMLGSYISLSISKELLKLYIGVLVLIVGLVVLLKVRFAFSWTKMGLIGLVSALNKALSGGGFGPFVTAGQVAIGQKGKASVGITTLAEVPIAMSSFAAYLVLRGSADWGFVSMLTAGSFIGAVIGPKITQKADEEKLKSAVGLLALLLGFLLIINVLGFWELKGLGV